MNKRDKIRKVMGEYKRGDLNSGSGKQVTDRDQAVAIAMSEARGMSGGGLVRRDGKALTGRTRGRIV